MIFQFEKKNKKQSLNIENKKKKNTKHPVVAKSCINYSKQL